MRNTRCFFCNQVFNDKHKYCEHIANKHNDQIPEDVEEPLEFAYSLLVHKPVGRLCVMCHKNNVAFNPSTLKYARLCSEACKNEYTKLVKGRMVNVYGHEHMLNDPDTQRKMLHNHVNAKDYKWDDKITFRVIGTYEVDFLNKLKGLDWDPHDIICPSPNNYYYKWDDGTSHLYIPDFFIPSLNLEVEIKQGNFNSSFMEHNRDIEHRKDVMMKKVCKRTGKHYIKIMDKNYDEFMSEYVESDMNQPE